MQNTRGNKFLNMPGAIAARSDAENTPISSRKTSPYILDDEYHYPYLCHDTDRDVTRINHEHQGGFHVLPPTLEMVSAINRHK